MVESTVETVEQIIEEAESYNTVAINQKTEERLKKIFEDAGISTDSKEPPKPIVFLSAVRRSARELVDLAVWRLEQPDMIGEISHDEAMAALTAIESLVCEIRRVVNEKRG
jgi:hypothetical protein